jgi:hypothetical protein
MFCYIEVRVAALRRVTAPSPLILKRQFSSAFGYMPDDNGRTPDGRQTVSGRLKIPPASGGPELRPSRVQLSRSGRRSAIGQPFVQCMGFPRVNQRPLTMLVAGSLVAALLFFLVLSGRVPMHLKTVSDESLQELGISVYLPGPRAEQVPVSPASALVIVQHSYAGMGPVTEEVLARVHFAKWGIGERPDLLGTCAANGCHGLGGPQQGIRT